MRNLFDPTAASEIKGRLEQLHASSPRQWGKMTVDQMVAHCTLGFQLASGELRPRRTLIGILIGRIIKPLALGDDAPMRKNSPTVPGMRMTSTYQLETEKRQLRDAIDRFVAAGAKGCTSHPHAFFGRLNSDEWAILLYKHLDHHLRQFGA